MEYLAMAIRVERDHLLETLILTRLHLAGITKETILDTDGITKDGYLTLQDFMITEIAKYLHIYTLKSEKFRVQFFESDIPKYEALCKILPQ